MRRKGKQKCVCLVVNAYFPTKRGGSFRPAQRAQWDFLLEESESLTIVVGDFNAQSPVWNHLCQERRREKFLEDLIDTFDLHILNNDSVIRFCGPNHSIINSTLATPGAALNIKDWRIVEWEEGTGSDHVAIQWRWEDTSEATDRGWKFKGQVLKERLDKNKEAKKRGEHVVELGDRWQQMAYSTEQDQRPILNNLSTTKQLCEEIDQIQERLLDLLNTDVKRITICARSKRWWNEDIRKKRWAVSRAEIPRK